MARKLASKRGETLAEVLAAVVVTALALLSLFGAISVFAPPLETDTPETQGTVLTTFRLGEESFDLDIEVQFDAEGYTYAPSG